MPEIRPTGLGIAAGRENDLMRAMGFIAGPAAGWGPTGAAVPTSQVIFGQTVYLYAGEVVTNIHVCVQIAGAGTAPSNIKLGLWDNAATPTCLAVTAELGADARWTTQGWKLNALSAPYTVPASGVYNAAFWINGVFASTNIQLVIVAPGALGQPGTLTTASGIRPFGAVKTGATTMAVSDTGSYSASGSCPAFYIS